MRTNIVIDDQLMRAAMEATGLATKKRVVEAGLAPHSIRGPVVLGRRRGERVARLPARHCDARVRLARRGARCPASGIDDLTLCEVLQGVPAQDAVRVRDLLLALDVLATGGTELALATAENYQALRRSRFTVRKTIHRLEPAAVA